MGFDPISSTNPPDVEEDSILHMTPKGNKAGELAPRVANSPMKTA